MKTKNKNKLINSKVDDYPNKFPEDTIINTKNNNDKKLEHKEENIISTIITTTNNNKKDLYNEQEGGKMENNILNNKRSSLNLKIEDYKELGDFSFINISEKVKPFLYRPQKNNEYSSHAFNNFYFLDIVNNYKMIINILVDDDSLQGSFNLSKIFQFIILSLKSLNDINISYKDFLVCLYFQHFSSEETFKQIFPNFDFAEIKNSNIKYNTFCCSHGQVFSVNDTPINILNFYKESASYVEVYKFFFCDVLNDLIPLVNADAKEIGKTFLIVNWPNGKIIDESINKFVRSGILAHIIRICNNRNMILIPDINYHPYDNKDYFGYINKYNFDSDKIYINLIWDMMCAYPIDHRYFYINMNFNLYLIFKEYYQNDSISIYSNEYYHDYNLSIYLQRKSKDVIIQKIQQVKIKYSSLPLNLLDIFYDFSLKRGSELANSLQLFPYFFSFRNLTFTKFLQKFVLLFKLICFFAEFFWLGLSLLISYAVFNETFGSKDNNMDYFCSLGYAVIVILLIFISSIFIKNKPNIKRNIANRNAKRNEESYLIILILYIIHYVYNLFFLCCCIIAVINVSKGKNEDKYFIFKKNYFLLLLILNILFALIPNLIRATILPTKGFLFYLILQFPNSTCFFHVPYLFICTRNINSEKKSLESLYVSLYLLLNGIFTVICVVFDTKRQRRMDFFYAIATILLVLNGIRIIILIFGCCWQNRFNRKISSGQIPQYNIVSSEYDNNNNNNFDYFIKIVKNKEIENKNFEKEHSSQININNKLPIIEIERKKEENKSYQSYKIKKLYKKNNIDDDNP